LARDLQNTSLQRAAALKRRIRMGMFDWTEKSSATLASGGVIAPDERLPWGQTAALGVQHVIAMFGATVLAPILMGFDPNVAILMSGIGTLLFFFITGGKVPSYLVRALPSLVW
jgi:putative pyrimidine permease RutG